MEIVRTALPPVEGVFFNGQIFDAYKFASDLIKSAKHSLVLIDNYVDEITLLLLSKRNEGVSATIYTSRISKQLQLDLEKHNAQFLPIQIRTYQDNHDRYRQYGCVSYRSILEGFGKETVRFSRMNVSVELIKNSLK